MTNAMNAGDMLVRLYDLPQIDDDKTRLQNDSIYVRRALVPERHIIIEWMRVHFSQGWASETEVALTGQPLRCFIAYHQKQIIGVSIYDAIARGVAGPIGLHQDYRQKGLGKVLLVETLQAMAANGYAYGIIGWTNAQVQGFYMKTVGAVFIEGSEPRTGMYNGVLI